MKKVWLVLCAFVLVLAISIVLIFSIPSLRFDLNEDLKGKVTVVSEKCVEYQSSRYYKSSVMFNTDFDSFDNKDDVVIGWNGSRLWYRSMYYSDTADKPVYIYRGSSVRELFLREDYDFLCDEFNVVGTNAFFTFEDSLIDTQYYPNKNSSDKTTITLISKTHENIKLELLILQENGNYYAIPPQGKHFQISGDFLQFCGRRWDGSLVS